MFSYLKQIKTRIEANSDFFAPILFTMSGFFSISMMILVKSMRSAFDMEPMVALFFRFLVVSCLMLPLMIKERFSFFFGVPGGLNIIKDVLSITAMIMWFQFGTRIPINDTTTLSFLTPVFVVVVDALLTRTKIEGHLWFSLIMCFVGVFFITGFDFRNIEPTYFLVIFVTLLRAFITILSKKVASYQTPTQILCSNVLISLAIVFMVILFKGARIPPMTPSFIFQILLVSLLFYLYYTTYVYGLKIGNVKFLQPFDFLRIVFSAILSFIFLSEGFSLNMILGSCSVILGVWYFLRTNGKKA